MPDDPDLFASTTVPDDADATDYRRNHRARLRARFAEGGAAALQDYELLEMLLFAPLARVDTKPLAARLLKRFGTLAGVLSADAAALREVAGAGPAVVEALRLAEAVSHRMARSSVMQRPVLSRWDDVLRYLRTAMAHRGTESLRVLYLDRKNVLIADEEAGRGTVDHVPVYPREVMKRALALNASALILVHNHPSGDPTPSRADIDVTRALKAAGEVLGIVLHDHLIVGRATEVSFRAEGLL
ncbi:RadC family protein [Jannaschia sp. LMIT008]|uniref:RadC family protein n=1 Tax=Jannaschia maritima TaxID=3032585 RepID=UPI002810D241|nr:DNA repair protein RadC [Jannaschia sp. LMIT008]